MLLLRIYTLFFGRFVGIDDYGNKYYRRGGSRWVIYKNDEHTSPVIGRWFAWIHHQSDTIVNSSNIKNYKSIEKLKLKEPSGSKEIRSHAVGDYQKWNGESNV